MLAVYLYENYVFNFFKNTLPALQGLLFLSKAHSLPCNSQAVNTSSSPLSLHSDITSSVFSSLKAPQPSRPSWAAGDRRLGITNTMKRSIGASCYHSEPPNIPCTMGRLPPGGSLCSLLCWFSSGELPSCCG